ncbi:methyltransferase domain-containing protein [Nostoc sp. DedQUE09]|uniref:methyltransferase domain-containing protein n=1 Tax=Nostoc sp. DedQUE09 TaxID=3075394 RepID=UPI002AD4F6FB|nr:methyltransferase domain-containing protein [Nostoc sp. DedQUE09]MDZ7949479.1 methyltransferase domain-containing protein [Nostoc sp. DedQUE09]
MKSITRQIIPSFVQNWLRVQIHGISPVGQVNFGDLRRIKPMSPNFGFDRGVPVDRYYIENFLTRQSNDIRGRVLEIGDNSYTRQFGGDRVTQSNIFHAVEGNPAATFVGDLTNAEHIPSDSFDCLILTQTLQLIYEVPLAIKTIYRILKPGGVVLVTIPGITSLCDDQWSKTWYWNYTTLSAQRLFEEVFPPTHVKVETYGNVLSATAFLQGLAVQELTPKELDFRDPNYEVIIAVRAVKPEAIS